MLKATFGSLRKSSLPATLIVSMGLAYYLFTSDSESLDSLKFHGAWSGGLMLGILGRIYLAGWINQIALNKLGANVGRWEAFSLACVASGLNMFMPFNSGALFRAVYFKRRYKMAYAHFASTQIGVQMLWVLAACGVSLVALFVVGDLRSPAILSGLGICLAGFAASLGAIYFPRIRPRNRRIWDKFALVSEGCHALRSNHRLMVKMLVLAIAKAGCDGLIFWTGCKAVGLPANVFGTVALTGFASLALCITLTPGGLGTYEALIGMISQAAELTSEQGVAVSLIVRGAGYGLIIILLPLCSWWLFTRRGWRWNEKATAEEVIPPAPKPFSQAA